MSLYSRGIFDWVSKHKAHQPLRLFLVSSTFGVLATLLLVVTLLQRNFFSKTYAALTLVVFVGASLAFHCANRALLRPFLAGFSRAAQRWMLAAAILLSLMLLLNFPIQPLRLLLPQSQVQVHLPAQPDPAGQPIRLDYLRNDLGYIHPSRLSLSGDWQAVEGGILIQPDSDFSLTWSGKAGAFVELAVQPSAIPIVAKVTVDGATADLDIFRPAGSYPIVYHQDFPLPWYSLLPAAIAFVSLSAWAILLLWSLLARLPIRSAEPAPQTKAVPWSLFALPALILWSLSLLTFWPGMLSNDSIGQWEQAVSGRFQNWHPFFHTFLISLLLKIWHSPAILAMAQMLALSLVFARGLGWLQEHGLPRACLWLLALLFAFFPPNLLLSITIWKDVAYAAALLGFFLLLTRVAWSGGQWLQEKHHWLFLALAAFLVASLRQNGLALVLSTLLAFLFIFRSQRRQLATALLLAVLAWGAVHTILGAFYPPTETNTDAQPAQANLILLSHTAAHVQAGTPLQADESAYLTALLPLDEWKYDCCYIGAISYHPHFDRAAYLANFPQNLRLALGLFLRDPLVDLRHQFCASEMNWAFVGNRCSLKSLHAFGSTIPSRETWIAANEFGLRESSFLPALIPFVIRWLEPMGFFTGQFTPFLKPAFYFYPSIFLIISACLRQRKPHLLALLIPILLQTLILALIMFAPSYRYQYGSILIGLFCLGLPLLPNRHDKTQSSEKSQNKPEASEVKT